MALILRQNGLAPLGQYDFLDTELASVQGGEVGRFASVANNFSDKSAFDSTDGYHELSDVRTLLRLAVAATVAPFLILDDGSSSGNPDLLGYGTALGAIIGSTVGQATQVSGATVIGPATHAGSGKVTAWFQPGLFGTSRHALTAGELATPPAPGTALFSNASGLLTTTSGGGGTVGYFVEWDNDESLVSTKLNNSTPFLTFLKA